MSGFAGFLQPHSSQKGKTMLFWYVQMVQHHASSVLRCALSCIWYWVSEPVLEYVFVDVGVGTAVVFERVFEQLLLLDQWE